MLTKTRSAFMQVRCAVVALWSEHEAAYATWIRPATTKLDSFSPTSSAPASLVLQRQLISGCDHAACGGRSCRGRVGSAARPCRGPVRPIRATGPVAGVRDRAGRGVGAQERLDAGRT